MLEGYAGKNAERYHMPGHKGKGCGILSGVYPYDITELSFSDNLANPCGVILKAENDIASLIGAKRCRILTGGSTLGVLVSVYSAKAYYHGERNKIIICKSSHKSVYNALALLDIEPVFLPEKIVDGLPCPNTEKLAELCDNGVIGALFTYPDYFGRCLNLDKIRKILKEKNCLLLLDGAHGAHLAFTDAERYGGRFADIWVDGAHKTLKTLTQGALLGVNETELMPYVEDGFSIFSTSSPNYLIMGSVEDGYKSFAETLEKGFFECKKAVETFKNRLNDRFAVINNRDFLKLCVDLRGFADGGEIGEYLEKNNVYPELAAGRFLIFMITPDFSEEKAICLADLLNDYKAKSNETFSVCGIEEMPLKRVMPYTVAKKSRYEYVELSDANGRISAGEVGFFPPCYPLIVAGEMFDNELIARLLKRNTFGIEDGKVKVVVE